MKKIISMTVITSIPIASLCVIISGLVIQLGYHESWLPTKRQLAWHKLETTAFVHFGINTFENSQWGWGNESPTDFDPKKFNAEQWVTTFKDAGFTQVVLTCKHHDGFCLWPSKYTDRSVISSPSFRGGHGDVVKEVSDACHKYGLKFGVYFSPWDRSRADFTTSHYIDYYCNQLTELLTNYGKISEVWFDCDAYNRATSGGWYGGAGGTNPSNPEDKRSWDYMTYYQWDRIFKLVRKLQPDAVMSQGLDIRTCGNELGIMGDDNWNTFNCTYPEANKWTNEQENRQDWIPWNLGHMDGKYWLPAECDASITVDKWFWQQGQTLKSDDELFQMYMRSVGRGAGLILNVPPDKDGLIPNDEVTLLQGYKNKINEAFGDKLGQARKSNVLDLKTNKTIKYVVVQENIENGQKIKSFEIQAWQDNQWKTIDMIDGHWDNTKGYSSSWENDWTDLVKQQFSTIGYKRILKLNVATTTNKIRVNILDTKNNPQISNIEVY